MSLYRFCTRNKNNTPRGKKGFLIRRLHCSLILLLLFFSFPLMAQQRSENILLLFSYHAGHEWEDSIYATMIQEMKQTIPGADFYLEYMDTKRNSPESRIPVVLDRMEHFRDMSFSLIFAVDDNALQFLADYGSSLFPSVPIVFCGINGYNSLKKDLPDYVTGVVSRINLADTAVLARNLIPRLKTFYILADATPTGDGNREMIRSQIGALPEILQDLSFEYVPWEMSTAEMLQWSETLGEDEALLMTSWYRDNTGDYIGEKELISLLQQHSAVPVFNVLHIRPGLLGGKVTSGTVQAEIAVNLASRIVAGTPASAIPVIREDTSIYTIDYQRFKYWGFSNSQLPDDAMILNPTVFYEQRVLVRSIILAFLVLISLLLVLCFLVIKLRRTGAAFQMQRNELFITLSSIGDGVISTDTDGRIVFMNRVAEKLTGWPLSEVRGKEIDQAFPIHNVYTGEVVSNPVFHVLKTGRIVELANHTVLVSHDGTEYHIADSAAPIKDPGKDVIHGVVLVFRDVSDSYRMRQRLQDERRRLNDAQAMAMVGNWEYDPDRAHYWFSPEVHRLVGMNKEVAEESLDLLKELFPNWRKGESLPFGADNKRHSCIMRVPRDKGRTPLDFHVMARTNVQPDSKKIIVTGILQDISELSETREALRESRQQLRQAARMEAVGKLAGGISHEFNNLLQVIMGYAQLLKEEAQDEAIRSLVEPILKTASSARNLTRQLLLFSRKESSVKNNISVSELIRSIMPILDRLLEANILLESELDGQDDIIYGDRHQIEQVLINLSLNARDAMGGKGTLRITQYGVKSVSGIQGLEGEIPPGEYVVFTVADTGSGIPSRILPEIFDPFFTTKDEEKGTGLGLSIVYGIIKQHSGYIHIETEEQVGTVFQIYLPRVFPKIDLKGKQDSSFPGKRGSGMVYIAEDDPVVRQLTETIVGGLGYKVKSFSNGKELVDFLDLYPPGKANVDLFLLDVVMPEMGGEEVYHRIRDAGYSYPVLFSSGYTREKLGDLNKLQNTRLIHKPFTKSELESHLNEMISCQKE